MTNNDNKNIQFTGDPVAFDGAEGKRDPKAGKGRFDLIPTEVYYPLFKKAESNWFVDCHPAAIMLNIANEKFIDAIIQMTIYAYSDHIENDAIQASAFWPCVWPMLLDLAIHFQKGAEHYGERNCQKGIPLWSFKDSAMRHAAQTFEGKEDEPHKISVIWNLWMAQWTVMQEKEKEGERRLLALERAAEAHVNSALGDNLKEAVTNLREVRKKLKTERHNCTNDAAKYDVLSHSIEGLKYVINMLYSIAEQTNTPIVTAVQRCDQGEYIMTPDGELPVSYLGEEWKSTKQPVDVLIHSDSDIPKDKRDALIKLCQALVDKKMTFDPNTCQDSYDKIIEEMAENAKEAGIPWPPKEPDVVPNTYSAYKHTMMCRCPTDVLMWELYERLTVIDRSEKIVKQNFIANFQDTMTKITQRYDAIKRGATGPIELPKVALHGGFLHNTKDVVPFPESWDQAEEVKSERVVDTVAIQQVISKLREELEKAHDIFTDTDGKGVQVFFKHLRPAMNDMLAMWNSITPMLLNEKTPEQ